VGTEASGAGDPANGEGYTLIGKIPYGEMLSNFFVDTFFLGAYDA